MTPNIAQSSDGTDWGPGKSGTLIGMASDNRDPFLRRLIRRASDDLEENAKKKAKYEDEPESVSEASACKAASATNVACKKLPPVNGLIEAVELKNFMCHDNLKIQFGTGINFVTGRNGSGKSAIMTGLVVGLGGMAAHTKRAQSLKALIKKGRTGRTSATVTVHLRNTDCEPYRHSEYGDSIVVERRISDDGSGQYNLKSHDGRTVASTKDELLRILDFFNIQVDNPVSFLNQDTSRNFLHSSKSKDKYELFMKATQLDQLKINYGQILEQREIMGRSLELKIEHLPELQRQVVIWEEKLKAVTDLDELIYSKVKVERMIIWAKVAEMEQLSQLKAKEIEKEERRVPKHVEKVDQYKSKVVKTEHEIQDLEKRLADINKEAKEISHKLTSMTGDLRQKKKAMNKARRDLQEIEQEYQSKQRERDGIQSQLQNMATTSTNSGDEKARRDARKQELEAEMSQIQGEMKEHQTRKRDLEETICQRNESNRELNQKTKKCQSEVYCNYKQSMKWTVSFIN
jgi:chromosome segregation ATPase